MLELIKASIKGRLGKNSIIILGLLIAVASFYISLNFTKTIEMRIAVNSGRLGPDLAVVPVGTKESGQVEATQSPPVSRGISEKLYSDLAKVDGIVQMAPEVFLSKQTLGNGHEISFIGFDPERDFVIHPWLIESVPEPLGQGQAYVGSDVRTAEGKQPKVGEELKLGLETVKVAGLLDKSGNYMDRSVFRPLTQEEISQGTSRLLVRVRREAALDQQANVLQTNFPTIEVLTRSELSKTLNTQLSGILQGKSLLFTSSSIILAMMLIMAAMFNLTVHEQKKDLGLFQAMGATRKHVGKLILGEALVLVGVGAALGLGVGALGFAVLNGLTASPGTKAFYPPLSYQLSVAFFALALAFLIGLIASVYPLLSIVKLEPYEAIRQGE